MASRAQRPKRRGHPLDPRTVRETARSQIGDALAELSGTALTDLNVHAARKSIKRARATLRLLRDLLSDTAYRRENTALREAARPLSAARDGKVLVDTLESLMKRKDVDPPAAAALHRILLRHRERLQRQVSPRSGVPALRRRLRTVHQRTRRWTLARDDGTLILHALKRAYRRGRRAESVAREERSTETLHEWRKEAKYLLHQLQLLEPLCPGVIGKLTTRLHKLSDALGDDHDLAVLREKVLAHPASFTRVGSKALLAAIEARRCTLQDKALGLGRRLYAKQPSEFAKDLGAAKA